MRKIWTIATVSILALSLAACGGAPDSSLGQTQDPIINGFLPDEPMHDAVVSLHQRDGDMYSTSIFCSGTMIAPDVVLTAAHCLNVSRNPRKVETMHPDNLVIYVGENPTTDPATNELHAVTETLIHPQYNPQALTNDIALVRIATPASVTPVPALPASLGFTTADEGITINFAGFGQDENDEYNQKLQVDGVLDHLQSDSQIYYYQYDAGPCFGDSGGPAFVYRNGTAYVGGITSYGDSACAEYGVSTAPHAFEAFIADFVGTVPDPYCGDGTCNGDEDCNTCPEDCGACEPVCGDGVCEGDEDCNTCPEDCGACEPVCGDGVCEGDETAANCPADCSSGPACGNGTCEAGEDCHTCPDDCVSFSHPRKGESCCGDGACTWKENIDNCAIDCL